MTDRPIIFSGPMVRALLDGRKSQTRRVLKPQPEQNSAGLWVWPSNWRTGIKRFGTCLQGDEEGLVCALMGDPGRRVGYATGDRLYVREAFNAFQFSQDGDDAWPVKKIPTLEECREADELGHRYGAPQIVYRESDRAREWFKDQKWRPSIHMPRWASRITLTVTEVRVQRMQEISEADAQAEGCVWSDRWEGFTPCQDAGDGRFFGGNAVSSYAALWNSLHGPDAWAANPWVVAVSFTVQQRNIDAA